MVADMEFFMCPARVKYVWTRVKFSGINAKIIHFCVIRSYQARDVVAFHKITGVSLYLSGKNDNLFKMYEESILHSRFFAKKVAIYTFFLDIPLSVSKFASYFKNYNS